MINRKHFCLILILIFALAGCQREEAAMTEPPASLDTMWIQQPFETIEWTKYGIHNEKRIDPQVIMDDPQLQQMVKQNTAALPLDSDEAVTAYAWDILSALIKCEYLPAGWVPILASHYSNDIWIISYADGSIDRSGVRDGTIDVYVAEDDGHIVFIYDI